MSWADTLGMGRLPLSLTGSWVGCSSVLWQGVCGDAGEDRTHGPVPTCPGPGEPPAQPCARAPQSLRAVLCGVLAVWLHRAGLGSPDSACETVQGRGLG